MQLDTTTAFDGANPRLSQHFRLSEFTHSQAAVRAGLPNQPGPTELARLRDLAALLEIIRLRLGGHPLVISSGYRSPKVNAIVGGDRQSAHLYGAAADFTIPEFGTPRQVIQAIQRHAIVGWDQLIDETGWVHIGLARPGYANRNEVLTAIFTAGQKTRYAKGLV